MFDDKGGGALRKKWFLGQILMRSIKDSPKEKQTQEDFQSQDIQIIFLFPQCICLNYKSPSIRIEKQTTNPLVYVVSCLTATTMDGWAEYLFLIEYEYRILFDFQKSPITEYWILFGMEKILIPNTIRYWENLNTKYK